MRNINISNFRKDIFTFVSQTIDFNEPINVSAKNGNVVVMSEEEYNGIMETMHLLSMSGMRENLLAGMNARREDLVEIDWRKDLR